MDPEPISASLSESVETLELSSSVQILTLPEGIYAFTIDCVDQSASESHRLTLPALQIGLSPFPSSGKVELLTNLSTVDRWLIEKTDMIVARIIGGDGAILLTSVRTSDSPSLSVNINRLNAAASANTPQVAASEVPATEDHTSRDAIPTPSSWIGLRLLTHIQYLGDLDFEDSWAGWPGQRLWIEGFAISSITGLALDSIEYCGVLASGSRTPWHRGGELCGSRGGGMPLLGFSARLRPEIAEKFECLYRGRFISGAIVGPLKTGEPCFSVVAGDPLEAIEIRVISNSTAAQLTHDSD